MGSAKQEIGASQIFGLVAMGFGTFVVATDFVALSVALPTIEKSFSADVTTSQWIVTGYALVFGIFIVTGGRLADMFGRRRVFFIGMTTFALFSLIGGLSEDIWVILIARAIMGIGGALMWPAILGITFSLLPEDRMSLGGSLIMGAAGFGNAAGPLLGGGLSEFLSWRWVFFMNIPVALVAMIVTYLVVQSDTPEDIDERVDYPGIVTLSLGLFGLLLLLDIGADLGWFSSIILMMLAGSLVMLALFFYIERRSGMDALVPNEVMSNSKFISAAVSTLLMSSIYFAPILYLPQFMVKSLGYSPLDAGIGMLPVMATFALVSLVAGSAYDRLGAKMIVSLGALCLGVGVLMVSQTLAPANYMSLVPGMVILGAGIGIFYSSITTAGITALDPSRASLAGAIVYMFQVAGGAIGMGLNTAIVVSAPTFTIGIERAFLVDAVLALGGLIICLSLVDGPMTRETLFPWLNKKPENSGSTDD
ncbi:MAG: MFS transporter [Proteobacteria bacterium]|nr:MFS transporter [Pseudomonadota bacterium]